MFTSVNHPTFLQRPHNVLRPLPMLPNLLRPRARVNRNQRYVDFLRSLLWDTLTCRQFSGLVRAKLEELLAGSNMADALGWRDG